MPFFDRFWGLRVVGAILAVLCALLFPLRFLTLALPFDQRMGISPRSDFIIAGVSGAVFAALAIVLIVGARRARERIEWRADAINGLDVIPREPIGDAHQRLEAPLELVWHISLFGRLFAAFWFPCAMFSAILFCASFVSGIVILISDNAHGFKTFHAGAGSLLIIAVFLLGTSWVFGLYVWDGLGRSPRITASEEGITSQPRWGATRFIRWEEMRLLEVWFYRRPRDREKRIILYSHDTAIRWNDTYARDAKYTQRHQLLDLIHERTGLLPSRLAQSVRAGQTTNPRSA